MRCVPSIAFVLAASLAACADEAPVVELTFAADPPVSLTAASRLSLSVYGYDAWLADAAATLIGHRVEPVAALPLVLELTLPADAHTLIDQGEGPVAREDARFYLAGIYIDVDGDGQVCPGDLSQDLGTDGPIDFELDGPIGPFAIPMKEWTDPCRAFPD